MHRFAAPMRLNRLSTTAGLFALALLFCACNRNGSPSDEDAQSAFLRRFAIAGGLGGMLELVSWEKTDGVPGDVYEYDYEARFKCLRDSSEWGYALQSAVMLNHTLLDEAGDPVKDGCRPGESVMIKGRVLLQRTEAGWRPYG